MEDAHIMEDALGGVPDRGFFVVLDGHGGKSAALFAQANMSRILQEELAKLGDAVNTMVPDAWRELFQRVYAETDAQLKLSVPSAGACVVTAFVHRRPDGTRWLYVANAGDSRAILRRGTAAVRLTEEHKPNDPAEAERLKAKGAFISDDGVTARVNGMIGISRALGDHMMKELIISTPYFQATQLTPEDSFLILACDGVWDVIKDQEATDLLVGEETAAAAAKKLLQHALRAGSTDNISVIVVRF
jgi:serine/threonine protein phosphatase PrpC